MIEVLKQMVEALKSATVDCSNFHHAKKDQNHNLGECPPLIRWHHAIEAGKQAIKELESQEPVERNWREAPWGFGEKRLSTVKYSDIVSDGGLDPRNKFDTPPQRTWVGLSMEQFEHFTSYVRADVLVEIEEALMENNT